MVHATGTSAARSHEVVVVVAPAAAAAPAGAAAIAEAVNHCVVVGAHSVRLLVEFGLCLLRGRAARRGARERRVRVELAFAWARARRRGGGALSRLSPCSS